MFSILSNGYYDDDKKNMTKLILCHSVVALDDQIITKFIDLDIYKKEAKPMPFLGEHGSNIVDHMCLPKYFKTRNLGDYIESSSDYFWSLKRDDKELKIKGGILNRFHFKFNTTYFDGKDHTYEEYDERLHRIHNSIPYFK
jgi:hypothetical protein